jgi:Predicted oxidoreductases of the aldo/keto reductase family
MQYRKFGKLDWEASVLGFGAMRLPTLDGNPMSQHIDEKEAIRMIRYAIDAGVNYVDTAYPYHGGNSEIVVGKALLEGYRSQVKLATKSPMWLVKEKQDFDKYLNEQLKKLQTDHIDFYLFHGLDKQRWDLILKLDLLQEAESAVKDGRIGNIGFSFHDDIDTFQQIINGYPDWTMCQIQYNYMDTEFQAGMMGLYSAASRGLAVVVMEPLRGGKLANPSGSIGELFLHQDKPWTPAEWALQWVWNHSQVSMLLSGMTTFAQLQENLLSADRAEANKFESDDLYFISQVRCAFESRAVIPCTQCGYCMPCISGVNIPKNFEIYNNAVMYDDTPGARFVYSRFLPEGERADQCLECMTCETFCPQGITISEWLQTVHATLGNKG